MGIDQVTVEDAVREWVHAELEAAVGERVIIADQGRARPERPYADVKLVAFLQRGIDERGDVDDLGNREIRGVRAIRATVRTFGATAMGLAHQARSALYKETVQDQLRGAGLSFWSVEDVIDFSAEIDAAIEPRATFDVLFGAANLQVENVGSIECVEISGEYVKTAGGEVVFEDDFEIVCTDEVITEDDLPLTEDGEVLTENP